MYLSIRQAERLAPLDDRSCGYEDGSPMSEFEVEPVIEKSIDRSESLYQRPAWVEVDLAAIRHNVGIVRREVGDKVLVMGVVKADGYGHGAVPVAKAAVQAGADWLGVALPEEGVELRKSGLRVPILVLSEPPPSAAASIVENDLSTTVCSYELIDALDREAARLGKIARMHLKVDTGMNRIGVPPEIALDVINYISFRPNSDLEGVFTHFAKADDPSSDLTALQFERFESVFSALGQDGRPILHAANSAATFLFPETHLDMVRVGISIYGLHPSPATKGRVDLKPAFSLKAKPSFVKEVPPGSGISYGHTKLTDRRTTIVTVPLGYGDGYSRRLSNRAEVLIGGRRHPIVGNICMDQLMVDVGPRADCAEGEIVLIGEQGGESVTVDEIADLLGTINYEVVCSINRRVPRIYLNE